MVFWGVLNVVFVFRLQEVKGACASQFGHKLTLVPWLIGLQKVPYQCLQKKETKRSSIVDHEICSKTFAIFSKFSEFFGIFGKFGRFSNVSFFFEDTGSLFGALVAK